MSIQVDVQGESFTARVELLSGMVTGGLTTIRIRDEDGDEIQYFLHPEAYVSFAEMCENIASTLRTIAAAEETEQGTFEGQGGPEGSGWRPWQNVGDPANPIEGVPV
jgi:hypothetical protein